MAEDFHIAATWAELRREGTAYPATTQNLFIGRFGELAAFGPDAAGAGLALWDAAGALVRGCVLEKTETMAALLPMVLPRVDAIGGTSERPTIQNAASNQAALALRDLAATGLGVAPRVDPLLLVKRLLAREPLSERSGLRTVWAALAHGVTDNLAAQVPFVLRSDPPQATSELGSNDARIIDPLYRCVRHAAGEAAARRGWRAWLEAYPRRYAAEWSSWPELLWSARAVHVVIGGQPEETLLDWLRSEIP